MSGNEPGGAGALGDTFFRGSWVAGGLLWRAGRGDVDCVIVWGVAGIGDSRAWAGGGGETDDIGTGGLGTIDLEPGVCLFGSTGDNGVGCTSVWGCAGGTSGLASRASTCTEEGARVELVAERTSDVWLESAACLSGAHGALTWMRTRIHKCKESRAHLVVRDYWAIRVTHANFHAGSRRGRGYPPNPNQLFPVSDICDRIPRDFW